MGIYSGSQPVSTYIGGQMSGGDVVNQNFIN